MKRSTQSTKTFLALMCAGLLLLAAAVSAGPSDDYPMTAGESSDETEVYITPSPVADPTYSTSSDLDKTPAPSALPETSAPTEYYMETTSEGGMEKTPEDPVYGDDDEETEVPMDNPDEGSGSSCTTYDEDEHVASLLDGSCEWNTYMCCWTGYDGPEAMISSSDVCRVMDYPEEGDVFEMPRDAEGPVYCHGFAWPDGADTTGNILPLYHFVKNFGRTEEGGYYGNVEGAPECGCIEDMPMVDDAECSRHSNDGIRPCNNRLRQEYRRVGQPNGDMETNLVRECDNTDVPDYDFRTCENNTYMCCWTENDGKGMKDNTDVCYVGDKGYPGESEGKVHCHGFVWPQDATDKYIHLLAQFVEHFDHRDRRGYYGNLPGAPMCGCIEDMPIVSEADCTTYDDEPGREGKFTACTDNDLLTSFEEHYPGATLDNLVGDCDNEE
eukprot:g11186.t1